MDNLLLVEAECVPADRPPLTAVAKPAVRRFYRPELDVMRFFAFLAVFVHHGLYAFAPLLSICGGFGLSFFFFLSAFLITELLQRERKLSGTISIRSFYIRRILRIWPLYLVFLAFAGLLGHVFPSHLVTTGFLLSFLLMVGNVYIGRYGFPDTPVGFLWSISIEEQFYLLWPLLNRMLRPRALVAAVLLFLPIGCISVAVLTAWHASPALGIWTNSFAQFQMFSLGALLALLLRGHVPRIPRLVRVILLLVGCLSWLLAAKYTGIADRMPHPGPGPLAGYYLVGLGCVAYLVGALGAGQRWVSSPLVYLGKISYGLYVFHQGSLEVAAHVLNATASANTISHHALFGVSHLVLGLLLTMILAAASYRFLETPFLQLKDSFTIVRSRAV